MRFTKNTTIVSVLAVFLAFIIFFTIKAKNVCDYEYWENAKTTKQIENIEICVKEGNVEAAVFLSNMYATGDTIEKNHPKAVELVKELAELGNGKAMIQMANLYSYYHEYKDFDKAEEWYKKAINSDDNDSVRAKLCLAKFYLGKYYSTKKSQYSDLYIDLLNKTAGEGNIEAMHLLASEYQEGNYITQNYYTALDWLKKAASEGSVKAYRTIGNYYANGFFGDADYKEAEIWFREAVKQGDDVAGDFLKSNPTPFDLEITKATVSDFKKKFNKYKKIDVPNFINGGSTYLVSPEYLPLDGIKGNVVFVFDKNSILESVLIVFDKSKYIDIKYHLKSKYTPFIEGAETMFTQGLTAIELMDTYVFYSWPHTNIYNAKVCTLIYKSRAFSTRIFEIDQAIYKREEKIKKRKMNLL